MLTVNNGEVSEKENGLDKLLGRLKFWVIKKIAGKDVVILNANIKIQDRANARYPIVVKGIFDSMLMEDNNFSIPDELEILIIDELKQDA